MKRTLVIASLVFIMPFGAFAATRTLSVGMKGSDVTTLQNTLISKGILASGKNTGIFDVATQTALQRYQCTKNIACSITTVGYGVYGPKTQASIAKEPKITPLEFSGWIPYWRTATGTLDVLPHLGQLSSVMPFGYTMHEDGTLADTAKLTEEPWVSFIAEARKQNVKVIPSVMWGNGDSIHKILSNATTRVALEDEIAKVVKDNNFDGIDIDFEAKKYETAKYFSTFLKGLYQRMGKKLVYCTIEARMPITDRYLPGQTVPADAMHYANDYKSLNKYCDRVEIMAYDQGVISRKLNKARMAPYAPVADPAWVESLVTLAMKDIDKKKIIIGVPTYGYEYLVTPVPGDGYKYKVLWPFNLKYGTDVAARLGITPVRTSAGEIGFSYDPARLNAVAPINGDSTLTQHVVSTATTVAENAALSTSGQQPFNFLSWSDATAVADKVALARKLGVRGVAVFKFDGGEDQRIWEILK
ncbi:MAG: glycosyl hydrolase family 18 protein [Candidatus Paceibacterota bacterium]